MAVDQYALSSLANVKEFANIDDDDVRQNGLAVYVSSADATAATIEVTDTTLVVIILGGADAGTTTKTFSDSTDDTLGELVTTLNAVSGIEATLLGPSARASTDLIRFPATDCLGQNSEQVLAYQGNALLEALINRISDRIEKYCGDRRFMSRDHREWHDGDNEQTLVLRHPPVTAVKRLAYGAADALTVKGSTTTDLRATVEVQDDRIVLLRYDSAGTETLTNVTFASNATVSDLVTTIDGTTGWSATLVKNWISDDLHRIGGQDALGRDVRLTFPDDSDIDYRVDEDDGLIELLASHEFDRGGPSVSRGFPRGFRNILVHYTGGYATVPDDLEQICIEMTVEAFRSRKHDSNLRSESIGSYAYTLASQVDIDADRQARLALWKDIR